MDIKANFNVGEYGYKSSQYRIQRCPQCKNDYRKYNGEIKFIEDGIEFCSWSCKCKYRQKKENIFLKKQNSKFINGRKNPTYMTKTEIVKEILTYDTSKSASSLFNRNLSFLINKLEELRKINDKKEKK